MELIELIQPFPVSQHQNLFRYRKIYEKITNSTTFNLNNKYNGYFYNLLLFPYACLNVQTPKKTNTLNTLKVLKNNPLFIKSSCLLRLSAITIIKNTVMTLEKKILTCFNFILNLFLQSPLYTGITLILFKQKLPLFFTSFFTISNVLFSYFCQMKISRIYHTILKHLQLNFYKFIKNIKNYSNFLYLKSTNVNESLHYYDHQPLKKLIFKNINFKTNTLFLMKYFEKFNKIKFIFIKNEKKYPTFIIIKFKASKTDFALFGLFSNICKKKVTLSYF